MRTFAVLALVALFAVGSMAFVPASSFGNRVAGIYTFLLVAVRYSNLN